MKKTLKQTLKQILKQTLKQYIVTVIISIVIISIGYFYLHGIPLMGLPKPKEVISVEIQYRNLDAKPRVYTDEDKIELAVKLADFLNYQPGAPAQGEAAIIITYHTKDGKAAELCANEDTVYWRGKAYKIKGDNGRTFMNLTEGVFFSEREDVPE